MDDNKKPTVSVCMITYNHEPFIRQAIDGILSQECNFSFELVIGEDKSSDNTRAICQEFEEKYPEIIKIHLRETNIGVIQNFIKTLKVCTGKYIALCEGDDYWTDPQKLQKQVDFLENNEDFAICFHTVKVWKEKEQIMVNDFITREVPEISDIYDLAVGNFIHTPSAVFRQYEKVLNDLNELGELCVGDYPLFMLLARYGRIKKYTEDMGVYRSGCGIWSNLNDPEIKLSNWVSMLEKLITYFEKDELIVYHLKEQFGCRAHALYDYYRETNIEKANSFYIKALNNNPKYLCERIKKDLENKSKELENIRNSKAYWLGKSILRPFNIIKNIKNDFNNYLFP